MTPIRIIGIVLFVLSAVFFYTNAAPQTGVPEEAGYGAGAIGVILTLFGREALKQFYLILINNPAFREALSETISEAASYPLERLYEELGSSEDALVDRIIGLHPDLNDDGTITDEERRMAIRVYLRDVVQSALEQYWRHT